MSRLRWLLPAAAFLFVACATSTPPPRPAPVSSSQSGEHETLREELEAARAEIVARERSDARGPHVDLEAVASIPIPDHRSIEDALKYFSTRLQQKIQASLVRSARYRALIDRTLEEYRLPKALAYLPIIESAFIPTLTSSAGAHGLWQFMPETARDYGLRVDWWVDERADPERSTRAAAAFLRDLYRQFGDWSLALAAYNCGPGRVQRTLKNTGASSFWELLEMAALPKETRGYVPTFYATLQIAGDPETHGFRLEPPVEVEEAKVEVLGPVSLEFIAEVAGTDEKTLRELNPSLHRGVVPPGKTAIRVPASAADVVAEHATTMREDDPKVSVAAFTLRKGDTVARLARRIGTTPETILAMNGLSSKANLPAGRSIYLPVQARQLGALLRHSDDEDVFYTVQKGDTLYSIARRHQLTINDLKELNALSDTTLQPGQKLRVSPPRGLTAGSM